MKNLIQSSTRSSVLVRAESPERERIEVLTGGAGRGSERGIAAISAFNSQSSRYEIVPTYVDPAPGKAAELAKRAQEQGVVHVHAVEARVQDFVLADRRATTAPIVLALDDPGEIARVLEATANSGRTTLVYLLVKRPRGSLLGVRMFVASGPSEERRLAILFFARLASFTLRRGSSALLGAHGAPEDLANEPLLRSWFAAHYTSALPKAVAGLTPECDPFEVTEDGVTTQPLFLVHHDEPMDPATLGDEILRRPSAPIARGTEFQIAEILPDALRFLSARFRKTDARVTVRTASTLERRAYEEEAHEAEARAARAEADAKEAEERAKQAAANRERSLNAIVALGSLVSRTNPVATTD